jgi:hypothetical protein
MAGKIRWRVFKRRGSGREELESFLRKEREASEEHKTLHSYKETYGENAYSLIDRLSLAETKWRRELRNSGKPVRALFAGRKKNITEVLSILADDYPPKAYLYESLENICSEDALLLGIGIDPQSRDWLQKFPKPTDNLAMNPAAFEFDSINILKEYVFNNESAEAFQRIIAGKFKNQDEINLKEFLGWIRDIKPLSPDLPIYLPDSFMDEVLSAVLREEAKKNIDKKKFFQELAEQIKKDADELGEELSEQEAIECMAIALDIKIPRSGTCNGKFYNQDGKDIDGFSNGTVAKAIKSVFPPSGGGNTNKVKKADRKEKMEKLKPIVLAAAYDRFREYIDKL